MKYLGWLAIILSCTIHALGAFERPSENGRLNALGNRFEETEPLRTLLTPNDDFPPIKTPHGSDWLTQHSEAGQSFDEFSDSKANRPDFTRRIIYLLPIGNFEEESSPPLPEVCAYATAFFQMETKLLPAYYPHELEFTPRKSPHGGQRQVLTKSILTFLKTQLPPDAYCILGVTMTDLYPAPSWHFVFGEASISERVGIFSFARYDPLFWGDTRSEDYRSLILQRTGKVLVHETAHMFGLWHCIYFDCVVNGSNGMNETDASPQHLCPICLRKLHSAIGFDAVKRYEDLARFYHGQKWYDDYDWVQRQLARVPQGTP